MKRILSIIVALVATITVGAQNIAVVNPSNTTKIYQTLDEAIINAFYSFYSLAYADLWSYLPYLIE